MEALRSQRLLLQCSSSNEICCHKMNYSPAVADCGANRFATQAGRVSLSSSTASCQSAAKDMMNWTKELCTTRAGQILGPSTTSALPAPRERNFLAGCSRKWSAPYSRSSTSARLDKEVLLVTSHPYRGNGRAYAVMVTTSSEMWPRKSSLQAENVLHKVLKTSGISIMGLLKRKRKEIQRSYSKYRSCSSHWRTPLVRPLQYISFTSTACQPENSAYYFPGLVGGKNSRRSPSYYTRFNSISSQAEGMLENSSLENGMLVEQEEQQQQQLQGGEEESYLATGYGWRVRDAAFELQELIKIADIQTGAFHEKSAVFDDIFYKIFHAEVLSSLQYKARHSDPGRYACLLAEKDQSMESSEMEPIVVGAVDITAYADKNIVCHLPDAEEYLYVSGMAVEEDYRRQGVATLLLEACLTRAIQWGFDYLVLHAYEDDMRAVNVYSKAGYETVTADPIWMTKFFGRRRRVVMARRTRDVQDPS